MSRLVCEILAAIGIIPALSILLSFHSCSNSQRGAVIKARGNMQIETFKILVDLAETASFSEAAERNGMTQSAVSQHIKVLEERFGIVLVERGRNNFAVTPEGEIFLKAGAEILHIYVSIWNELELLKNSTSGMLKVATVFSVGFHELPPVVDKFRETFPKVKLEVKYRRDREVYADVLENKVDLGIVAYPQTSKGIEITPAWSDRLVAICSHEHRLAERKSIDVKSLGGEQFISFHPDPPTRDAIENMLHNADVRVEQVMVFDNIETVKRAVEIEGAISIVPADNCLNEVKAGTLHQIDLEAPEACRPLGILRRSGKASTRAMDAMVDLLQSVSRQE